METQLILKPVTGYEVIASVSETRDAAMGVYKSYSIALARSKKAGWYESDGTVISITLHEDQDGNLYRVSKPFQFVDVKEETEAFMKASIESKLTEDELKYIKFNK